MPSRTTWEEIAYFPTRHVFSPLIYTCKGIGLTIGFIDDSKVIQRVDDILTSDDGRRGVQPTYNVRTGGGLKFYQKGVLGREAEGNIFELTATTGLDQERLFLMTLDNVKPGNDFLYSDILVQYRKLTTESFFGIGRNSRLSDESGFVLEQTSAEITLGTQLHQNVSIKALTGYEYTDIAEGYESDIPSTLDLFTEASLAGIETQVEMAELHLILDYDSRNRPGNPTKGFLTTLSGGVYHQIGDDLFGFSRYTLDTRWYLHLFCDRVLILRTAAEINSPFDDREIPFYYKSELGSKETIRGFERGRFRDRDMLLGSIEYRYPVWRNWNERGLDVLLFTDTGQVSRNIVNDAMLDRFETGYGFGFRLWNLEGLVAKFEAGWSKDGWRLYLGLN